MESFKPVKDDHVRFSSRSIEDLHALFQHINTSSTPVDVLIDLRNLSPNGNPEDVAPSPTRAIFEFFTLAKSIITAARQPTECWIATTDAWRVTKSDTGPTPELAALWSSARVLAREATKVSVHLVDFSSRTFVADTLVKELLRELGSQRSVQETAYRDGRAFSPSLRLVANDWSSSPPLSIRERGVYLITGGLGDLGLELAKHLARRSKPRLVLLSRSTLPPEPEWDQWLRDVPPGDLLRQRILAVRECRSLGAEVVVESSDVGDLASLQAVFARIDDRFGMLHGVFHVAGIARDCWIVNKSLADFEAVLVPKVQGVQNLDRLARRYSLDFFIGYSSFASLWGTEGQADYAAANAYLDAYLAQRQMRGHGKSMALSWSAWSEIGMAARTGTENVLAAEGWRALPTALANELFDACFAFPATNWVIGGKDDSFPTTPREPFIHAPLTPVPERMTSPPLAERLEINALRHGIAEEFASVLDIPPNAIDVDQNVREYGIDSILATRIAASLSQRFEVDLAATLLFTYPTVEALAAHLRTLPIMRPETVTSPEIFIPDADVMTPPCKSSTVATNTPVSSDIAVIGIGCRFPGADSPVVFWKNLCAGFDGIASPSKNRASCILPAFAGDDDTSRPAGYLEDVAGFDAPFFGISAEEARAMDPQQRIFLEVAWQAVESAGYRPETLAQSRTAVFAGVTNGEYIHHLRAAGLTDSPFQATGNTFSMVANRVSYLLGLRGPSESIDTACSSSLVAIHRACASLRHGECDYAIAGGVNLLLTSSHARSLRAAGMLSPDGHCHVFDDSANGYVRGEGAGALLLKPLANALQDGDIIWGVLKGTAVNHDGRAKAGFTAPSPSAQLELLQTASRNAGVEPSSLGFIESHGTGTSLGDPIEVSALNEFLNDSPRAHCALGSVKTNLGHLESAAGVTGLIKAILAVRHRQLPPSIHFQTPNRHIDFVACPFFINDRLRPWHTSGPRRGGVSSFGAGGTNAHAIVEEPPALPPVASHGSAPRLLTLSARTESALRTLVEAFREVLNQPSTAEFFAICHTANRGRAAFEFRLAIIARSNDQLHDKLLHLENWERRGRIEGSLVFFGHAEHADETQTHRVVERIERLTMEEQKRLFELCRGSWFDGKILPRFHDLRHVTDTRRGEEGEIPLLSALAAIFCAGGQIDWDKYYRSEKVQRVVLPGYPFERIRYWAEPMPITSPVRVTASSQTNEWLHVPCWESLSVPDLSDNAAKEPAIFCSDGSSQAKDLADAVRSRGWDIFEVNPRDMTNENPHPANAIFYDSMHPWEALLRQRPSSGPVIYCWPGQSKIAQEAERAWNIGLRGLFELCRAWSRTRDTRTRPLRLIVVTSSGCAMDDPRKCDHPEAHLFWGVIPTLRLEFSDIHATAIDVDFSQTMGVIARQLQRLSNQGFMGDVLATREERWYRRSTRPDVSMASSRHSILRDQGVYLITGGLGGIGLSIAQWLARGYRAKVALVQRNTFPSRSDWPSILASPSTDERTRRRVESLESIESLGSGLHVESADVADLVAMQRVIDNVERKWGRIDGIIHAAGVRRDGRLLDSDWKLFQEHWRTKVRGALVLDQLTRTRPETALILFSSLAATLGNIGQAIYGAANAFLDGLAAWRTSQGRRSYSIQWGPWLETGMAAGLSSAFRNERIEPLPPSLACQCLELAVTNGLVQSIVGKWSLPKYSSIAAVSSPTNRDIAASNPSISSRSIVESLRLMVADLLELPADRVSVQRPLFELGIDSVLAVRLIQLLGDRTRKEIPRTFLFDHPTVERIAEGLAREGFPLRRRTIHCHARHLPRPRL
ncbi:MAG: SDR family oxidoreductase [Planctomycetota bacterium]